MQNTTNLNYLIYYYDFNGKSKCDWVKSDVKLDFNSVVLKFDNLDIKKDVEIFEVDLTEPAEETRKQIFPDGSYKYVIWGCAPGHMKPYYDSASKHVTWECELDKKQAKKNEIAQKKLIKKELCKMVDRGVIFRIYS